MTPQVGGFSGWSGDPGDLALRLERTLDRLERLALRFQSNPTFQDCLRATLEEVIAATPAERAWFLRVRRAGSTEPLVVEQVVPPGDPGESFARTGFLAELEKRPILLSSADLAFRAEDGFLSSLCQINSVMGAPLLYDTEIIGFLVFASSDGARELTEEDRELLDSICLIAALALPLSLQSLLHPSVARIALTSPDALRPTGQDVVVLFVDIRNYSGMVHDIHDDPEAWASFFATLGCFRDSMMRIAGEHRGVPGSFAGDGFLVLYGAPEALSDAADLAVQTAIAMQHEMLRLRQETGFTAWKIGVGIAGGQANVGSITPGEPIEYSVIGHPVNLAARLTGEALPGEILIDGFVFDSLTAELKARVEPLGKFRFKSLDRYREPVWLVDARLDEPGSEGRGDDP